MPEALCCRSSSVAGSPCLLGSPRGVVWAKTYARASHLRNEDEQGSQMGEISCVIEGKGQRIVPGILHRVRSREQAIPSIRKRFILSDYARAGEESQQRREGVCLAQSSGARCGFGVVNSGMATGSDERVSEVVVVVVRLCWRERLKAKFHSMGEQLVPASPESLCKW